MKMELWLEAPVSGRYRCYVRWRSGEVEQYWRGSRTRIMTTTTTTISGGYTQAEYQDLTMVAQAHRGRAGITNDGTQPHTNCRQDGRDGPVWAVARREYGGMGGDYFALSRWYSRSWARLTNQ